MRRLLVASLLFSLSALGVACGGRALIDPSDGGSDTDPSTETGVDTGFLPDTGDDAPWWDTDVPPWDTGPGACGVGRCSPGEACFDGCNSCSCGSDGYWGCTARWCEDSGPPPDIGPPPACPKSLPPPGSYCPGPLKCSYMNSCGSADYAWCEYPGAAWNVSIGPCTGTCPSSLPKDGTSCSGPAKCDYWKSCGTSDFAYCDTSTYKWRVSISECPPPPPTCPTTEPKEGSPCSGFATCAWNNGCGALKYGYCESGRWWISDSGCVPGCPSAKPSSGTACKPPSATSCTYVVPSKSPGYCESNCFCAEDYRWACIPGGCTSGGGGWADAGPPEWGDAGIPPSP